MKEIIQNRERCLIKLKPERDFDDESLIIEKRESLLKIEKDAQAS